MLSLNTQVNITVNEDVLMGTLSPYCKAVGMLVKKHVLDEVRDGDRR